MAKKKTGSATKPAMKKKNEEYTRVRSASWDSVARRFGRRAGAGGPYCRRLAEVYRFRTAPGLRVLEIGCAQGDLLADLKPAEGIGVDFSPEMIERALRYHPELRFILADAHEFSLDDDLSGRHQSLAQTRKAGRQHGLRGGHGQAGAL